MSEKMRRSIRGKLITMAVTISTIVVCLLGVVSWGGINEMKKSSYVMNQELVTLTADAAENIVRDQAMLDLRHLAEGVANSVDTRISSLMDQVTVIAAAAQELYRNPSDYSRIPINPPDEKNKGKYVGQVVYADRANSAKLGDEVGLLGNLNAIMNQVSQSTDGVSSTYIGTESGITVMYDDQSEMKMDMENLDPVTRLWYTGAEEEMQVTWTPVFEDSFGRGLTLTCSAPVYDKDYNLKAVVALGAQLSDLSAAITGANIGDEGAAFVVDKYGDVIMRTHLEEGEEGVVTERENLYDTENPYILEVVEKMKLGESGIFENNFEGNEMYWAYEPMECMPWTVVVLFNASEVLGPVMDIKNQTNELAITSQQEVDKIVQSSLMAMFWGMIASGVLAIVVGLIYANKLAQPIRALEKGVKNISKGNLDYKIDITTGDEIESLATAFNDMTNNLEIHISKLTSVTAEREKVSAELDVATKMQLSMLPNKFPAFPEYDQFDLYATMIPAKEVGGDFYDFFMVGDDHLVMVIADVSGKGVPAALFMVKAKTLIQNYAQKGISSKEILEGANHQLCSNNDAGMFVTAWVGVLDIHTGELAYSNAGHNKPIIKRKDGTAEYVDSDTNFVLAGIDDMEYSQQTIKMCEGDTLCIYTDGVTEASNKEDEFYTQEKLLDTIKVIPNGTAKEVVGCVKKSVDEFVENEPQYDDITMLTMVYKP